jgi:hypothetical protein
MFWTEAYLLQAFLSHNEDFEIILPMFYLQNIKYKKEFRDLFPKGNNAALWGSTSFWIKRKN